MPVPPRPVTFHCPHCQWQRTLTFASDVIRLPDWARRCPRCGTEPLQQSTASLLQRLLGHRF